VFFAKNPQFLASNKFQELRINIGCRNRRYLTDMLVTEADTVNVVLRVPPE
jgi:hypothetical protein